MLVLSRKTGDEIVIDQDIRIAVLATSGRAVRLGVVVPPEARLLRREVHDRIAAEASSDSTIMSGVIRVAR